MEVPILEDNDDAFVLKEEPLVDVEDEFGPSFFILLRNFEFNSATLKAEHRNILQDRVAPFIKNRVGFAEIYAMTDRSGSRQVNYEMAARRLREVQQALLSVGAPLEKVHHAFAKSLGEDFFEAKHETAGDVFEDGRRDGSFRSVMIALTPAPIGLPTKIFRARFAANAVAFGRFHFQRPG
jgi:outer membrane protein OmpA-like peptidoglycan-associated protein